ncbi:hypothetical protein HYU07_01345 [Candidatus Woesearchaeota archaeon]|nr:hypothetical protein [Candidatus Woesearchaeota archaeon]
MICLIALVVFGVLGIFSSTHRMLAKEAFDCVFRRLTLRKCESGLDKRLKSQITGKLMRKTPRLAGFTYKNFELISWIFTIMFIASIVWSGHGIYNLIVYKNCNGLQGGACIFNPSASESLPSCSNSECPTGCSPICRGGLNCTCKETCDKYGN